MCHLNGLPIHLRLSLCKARSLCRSKKEVAFGVAGVEVVADTSNVVDSGTLVVARVRLA
jgi:hypothetical protein